MSTRIMAFTRFRSPEFARTCRQFAASVGVVLGPSRIEILLPVKKRQPKPSPNFFARKGDALIQAKTPVLDPPSSAPTKLSIRFVS